MSASPSAPPVNPFSAPPGQEGKVRTLLISIGVMTVMMVFMLGMILGRLLAPGGAPPAPEAIAWDTVPVMEIRLPADAQVVRESVGEGRVLIAYETPDGARGVLSAPAPVGAAHLVYVTDAP